MTQKTRTREGKRSIFGPSFLLQCYGATGNRAIRSLVRRLVLRLEGGAIYSLTIRQIYRQFHGLDVGLYTIGPCDVGPGNLAPGTTVGRYSSIYYTVRTLSQDYPVGTRSTHGLFCDDILGEAKSDQVRPIRLLVGNDVFMGHNVIILPSAEEIGDGAVIGAGSVVRSRVPPYAVVTGNPARVVRYRFSEKRINELLESRWWLKSIDELNGEIEEFQRPLEGAAIR